MTRRTFSAEFKHDAASLVVDQNYTVTQACEAMGVITGSNFSSGMKIQVIGTVIDITGDYNTVLGQGGSHDFTEFLGRSGVSLVKAGATAALGSITAGGVIIGIPAVLALFGFAAAVPIAPAVVVVVAGYVVSAWVIDLIDDAFDMKHHVADMAR